MKIAVDLMGGDKAPGVVIEGIGAAIRKGLVAPEQLVVIGTETALRSFRLRHGPWLRKAEQVKCLQVVRMNENLREILKKRKSSIALGIDGLKRGEYDAFVSAGNTAAIVTFGRRLGKLIKKPAIAAPMPNLSSPCLLIDAGANSGECTAEDLAIFALMGSIYVEKSWQIDRPKVALLSNGSEETKGTPIIKAACQLIKNNQDLNFAGYVEGDQLFTGPVNVIVCDGFVGNVVLKSGEGLVKFIAAKQGILWGLSRLMSGFYRRADYRQAGGAPLLGIKGTVIIAHGKSKAPVIANAIKTAVREVEVNINAEIAQRIKNLS